MSALLLVKLGCRDIAWNSDQGERLFPTSIPDIGDEVGSARAYSPLLPHGGAAFLTAKLAGSINCQRKMGVHTSLLEVKVLHRRKRTCSA